MVHSIAQAAQVWGEGRAHWVERDRKFYYSSGDNVSPSPLSSFSNPDPTIAPLDIVANEGENATFTCAPFIPAARPILHTSDPDSDNLQTVNLLMDSNVDHFDSNDSRTFIWIEVNRTEDHLRRFQCDVNTQFTDIATLQVNCKLVQYHIVRTTFLKRRTY